MKKIVLSLLCFLLLFVSCENRNPIVLKHYDTTSIKFEDKTVVYSGNENVILVSGNIPEGVSVQYDNNKLTDAGTISATARFVVPDGYAEISPMHAVLTVTKAQTVPNEISFHNDTFQYDGNSHEVKISGILPDGYSVEYKDNIRTEVGTSKAVAHVYDKNHEGNLYAELNIDSRNVHRIANYSELVSELSDFKGKTKDTDIFVLVSDIDCSSTTESDPWKSIGAYAGTETKFDNGFKAEFDGQGYAIKNIYITEKSDTQAAAGYPTPGFFAGLVNASVHDIVFDNPRIKIKSDKIVAVGLVIGQSPICSDIYNITVNDEKVNVEAIKIHCGGLIGFDQQFAEKADSADKDYLFKRDALIVSDLEMNITNINASNGNRSSIGGIVGEFMDRGAAKYSGCEVSGTILVNSVNADSPVYEASIVGLIKGNKGSTEDAKIIISGCTSSLSLSAIGNVKHVSEWTNKYESETVSIISSVFSGNL